jgi:tRNA A-37 threonylcarbamoyl transferase component Bud32
LAATGPFAQLDLSLRLEVHPEAAAILGLEADDISDFFRAAIAEHQRLVTARSLSVRKNAPESAVSLVEMAGLPGVCVKEFRWRGWLHGAKGLLRPTQGLRTFRNGRRLLEAGVGVAVPLALVRNKRSGLVRTEWVVMQMVPGALELDRFILKGVESGWDSEQTRALVRLLGRFIGSMHAKGLFHADLKTCNILVSQEAPSSLDQVEEQGPSAAAPVQSVRFSLLDYDDVSFSGEVSLRRRLKNLVQIFLSTPLAVNASSRRLFLSEYSLHAGLNRQERREMARQVLKAATGKEILYVGFDGDIREKWH